MNMSHRGQCALQQWELMLTNCWSDVQRSELGAFTLAAPPGEGQWIATKAYQVRPRWTSSLYLLFGSDVLYPVAAVPDTGLQNLDTAHLPELMITLHTSRSMTKAGVPTK